VLGTEVVGNNAHTHTHTHTCLDRLSVRQFVCLESVLWQNSLVDPDTVLGGEWGSA